MADAEGFSTFAPQTSWIMINLTIVYNFLAQPGQNE